MLVYRFTWHDYQSQHEGAEVWLYRIFQLNAFMYRLYKINHQLLCKKKGSGERCYHMRLFIYTRTIYLHIKSSEVYFEIVKFLHIRKLCLFSGNFVNWDKAMSVSPFKRQLINQLMWFLAHLSKRKCELLPSLGVRRRPSSSVRRKLFQRSSPLKLLNQFKPNFIWLIPRVSRIKIVF